MSSLWKRERERERRRERSQRLCERVWKRERARGREKERKSTFHPYVQMCDKVCGGPRLLLPSSLILSQLIIRPGPFDPTAASHTHPEYMVDVCVCVCVCVCACVCTQPCNRGKSVHGSSVTVCVCVCVCVCVWSRPTCRVKPPRHSCSTPPDSHQ